MVFDEVIDNEDSIVIFIILFHQFSYPTVVGETFRTCRLFDVVCALDETHLALVGEFIEDFSDGF